NPPRPRAWQGPRLRDDRALSPRLRAGGCAGQEIAPARRRALDRAAEPEVRPQAHDAVVRRARGLAASAVPRSPRRLNNKRATDRRACVAISIISRKTSPRCRWPGGRAWSMAADLARRAGRD